MPAYSGLEGFITAAGLVHSRSGKIQFILVSHAEAAAETVTLYDGLNTTSPVLLQLKINPGLGVQLIRFEPWPLTFVNGLYVDPGNCEVYMQVSTP
jgi:hypothetical protein